MAVQALGSLDEFFAGYAESRRIFDIVQEAISGFDPLQMRITKSQVAFRRKRGFAWTWIPGKYLSGRHAPLVLSLSLQRRDASPRWKEIVEPTPGRFMHHLELYSPDDVNGEVHAWLKEAWEQAS